MQADPPIRRRQAGDEREELLQPSLYSQRSVRMESKAMVGRGRRPPCPEEPGGLLIGREYRREEIGAGRRETTTLALSDGSYVEMVLHIGIEGL